MRRRLIGWGQDLAALALVLLAVLLVLRLPAFRGALTDRLQSLLSAAPAAGGEEESAGLGAEMASVDLMVTGTGGHERFARLSVDGDDPLLAQCKALLREALGSAGEPGEVPDSELRAALAAPGVYLRLPSELPLEAVCAWLEEEDAASGGSVRALALTAEEGAAALYLQDGGGAVTSRATALPASAVEKLCAACTPNAGAFAWEAGYDTLEPYAILAPEPEETPCLTVSLPAGYSAYNLLTALDFNAHTGYRYPESGGAEVIVDSPRTLRVSPDGTVSCTVTGTVESPLYRSEGAGTAGEAVRAAGRIAQALTEGAAASPLYLCGAEETEDGWRVAFRYQWEGLPIYFSDGADALTVTVRDGEIAGFTYRSRLYAADGDSAGLLPASMAVSIASMTEGGSLTAGYVDTGAETLQPQWLDQGTSE